ncbi:MAG: protein kinase [Planctomycetaceae bacterium]|jgi:phosphoglycerate dehydrogenase-like enzyme/serine/threonine protein kinase|nr:protein kinase [Planctomycetaceae bacterium]
MPNLVVCFKDTPVEKHLIDPICSLWSDVNIINVGQDGVADALLQADYFCGHAKVPVDWNRIVGQKRLQWIQSSAAGMDWCLVPSVIDSDITITTASGVLADQVAEHTLSLILGWMRNLPVFFNEQYNPAAPDYRKFIRRPTRDLTDSTVGIVGFGGVGRRLAELLIPFHTSIIATDVYPTDKPPYVDELWYADRLDDLLIQSDVTVLCLPLNNSTRGLFSAERLKKIKPDSLLVNAARGQIIVTDDLVSVLKDGHLAGCVMDVTSPEPLPPDNPLWDFFPQVIITPHVGGQSSRRFADVIDIFTANIKRRQSGQPLINYLTDEGKKLGFPIRCTDYPLWIDMKPYYRSIKEKNKPLKKHRMSFAVGGTDSTTAVFERTITHFDQFNRNTCSPELKVNYYDLLDKQRVRWNEDIVFKRMLGQGGQGIVFLSELVGSDRFAIPIAVKVFSPERFADDILYDDEMFNMAKMTAKIAKVQHDHLLVVYNWRATNRIHFMLMEWVDGFDVSQILKQGMLDFLQKKVKPSRWNYINRVVVTGGVQNPRMMPGVAVPIIRECLAALAALHRVGIVHGDVKPSNIMLKRTGSVKLIDMGSSFEIAYRSANRPYTLAYAPPEVLEGKIATPQSDIASLGYVLIEMLSGRRLFTAGSDLNGIEGRLLLANRLNRILPPAVAASDILMNFCQSLIAPDPDKRFADAEAADLFKDGAADFQRQLIKGDLSCESEPEIRNWLNDLTDYQPGMLGGKGAPKAS